MKNLSRITVVTFIALTMFACKSVTQIGDVNMVSTRNVDSSQKYVLIKTYAGGSKRQLKKSKAKSLEQAINATVKETPGGEYLQNVKIYLIKGKYIAVEGDVWGIEENANVQGFKVVDQVQWGGANKHQGVIVELVDDKECMVRPTDSEDSKRFKYKELTKIGQ